MKNKLSFKDVGRFVFMYEFDKKGKIKFYDCDNEFDDSPSTDTLYKIFKDGGKELRNELLIFVDSYFQNVIFKKVRTGFNMAHGNREYLLIVISCNGCEIYYSNRIITNSNIDVDWSNDKITYNNGDFYHYGYYDIKNTKGLLELFKSHLK